MGKLSRAEANACGRLARKRPGRLAPLLHNSMCYIAPEKSIPSLTLFQYRFVEYLLGAGQRDAEVVQPVWASDFMGYEGGSVRGVQESPLVHTPALERGLPPAEVHSRVEE